MSDLLKDLRVAYMGGVFAKESQQVAAGVSFHVSPAGLHAVAVELLARERQWLAANSRIIADRASAEYMLDAFAREHGLTGGLTL